jgi:hypothetical protein
VEMCNYVKKKRKAHAVSARINPPPLDHSR